MIQITNERTKEMILAGAFLQSAIKMSITFEKSDIMGVSGWVVTTTLSLDLATKWDHSYSRYH